MRLVAERPADPRVLDKLASTPRSAFHDSYDRVVDALDCLTPRQRELVDVLYWERLTQSQVARRWGVSRQAVHATLRRAKRRLRGRLDGRSHG